MHRFAIMVLLMQLPAMALALDPLPGNPMPFRFTAYPEASSALFTNPAGFPWLKFQDMTITWAFTDSTWEGLDGVALQSQQGGIAGWWEDRASLRRFDTGAGIRTGDYFTLGTGFSWFDPTVDDHPLDGATFFTLGACLRPSGNLSAGITWRSSAGEYDQHTTAGLALRPAGSRVTVTGDWAFTDWKAGDGRWQAGLEVLAVPGLTVRGSISEDLVIAGLQLDFQKASARSAFVLTDGSYSGGTGSISILDRQTESFLNPSGRFLEFRANSMAEEPSRRFLGPRVPSFSEQMVLLRRAAQDPDVPGLLVDYSDFSLNAAQTEELRETMVRFREQGKPVFAYIEYAGTSSYYSAAAARKICMHPAGQISISGFTTYTPFLRGLLDRLGIFPDLMHIGDFKSASDMLTRTDMTDAQREATRALLESARTELARGLADGRGYEPAQVRSLFTDSPYWGARARQMSLVDTLIHPDQFHEFVEGELARGIAVISPQEYQASIPPSSSWLQEPRVAVVIATGNIVNGESGGSIMGANMGSDTIVRLLERAAATRGVKALVLRIDSGGGDAMASDDMNRAVERIRERMPVVVSMGSVAASGGYYMACGADAIFADRLTVTGSIGIITGKFVFGELLDRIGINVESVSIDPEGSPGNPFEPYTEDEWQREFQAMRGGYELFVNTVARGRGMTFEQVDSIAQGRVWSGSDALDLGLVDYNGGVADAVALAARLGGIETPFPELVVFPEPSPFGSFSPGLPSLSSLANHPLLTGGGYLYLGDGLR